MARNEIRGGVERTADSCPKSALPVAAPTADDGCPQPARRPAGLPTAEPPYEGSSRPIRRGATTSLFGDFIELARRLAEAGHEAVCSLLLAALGVPVGGDPCEAVWACGVDSARHLFEDLLDNPYAWRILEALRERPEGMTRTQIRDYFHRHHSRKYDEALKLLLRYGLIRVVKERPTGVGRPAERYFLVETAPGDVVDNGAPAGDCGTSSETTLSINVNHNADPGQSACNVATVAGEGGPPAPDPDSDVPVADEQLGEVDYFIQRLSGHSTRRIGLPCWASPSVPASDVQLMPPAEQSQDFDTEPEVRDGETS